MPPFFDFENPNKPGSPEHKVNGWLIVICLIVTAILIVTGVVA